jgi:hypothetical protein
MFLVLVTMPIAKALHSNSITYTIIHLIFVFRSTLVPLQGNLHADAESKTGALKNRLLLIRQRLARKDTFSEPLLKSLAGKREYFQVG